MRSILFRSGTAEFPTMLKHLASVGGYTLLSRFTGFASTIVMADVMGAGRLFDAFSVAFRIPNHFRAIFAEGAFNAAYIPTYARLKAQEGPQAAKHFSSQIFTLLLVSQLLLLALAWLFMPQVIGLLAPGYDGDPEKFQLAQTMTRITFPYLACIVLVTLHSATLNANRHFAAAAFASVLLNLSMMACLGLAFLFPNAGIAASVGVLISGFLQLGLVMVAARRAGVLESLASPRWGSDLKRFFTSLGPNIIASAGVQIAIFADTIIASTLADGGQSSLVFAERLYQLPIGVIGVAAGTVLLPEMSRRLATGDATGAARAQNRTLAITLALSAPFCVLFLSLPDLVMRVAFVRGAFTPAHAAAAANVLWAYGFGLLAVVSIRSAIASFQARGNVRTPMFISLFAVAINVALKLVLIKPFGASGLAFATAAGAWINLALLLGLSMRAGFFRPDPHLVKIVASVANATIWLILLTMLADQPIAEFFTGFGAWSGVLHLGLLGGLGMALYFGLLLGQMRLLGLSLPAFGRGLRK